MISRVVRLVDSDGVGPSELGLQGGISMRRKYFGLAIAAFATLGPMQAWGGDREIAEQIIQRLKTNRDSGALKDFTLDMKVDQGVVIFRGDVSQQSQRDLVLKAAEGIDGVTQVVDEVKITTAGGASVLEPQAADAAAEVVVAKVTPAQIKPDFSLREALASQAKAIQNQPHVMPGKIQRTAAEEPAPLPSDDQQVVAAVVAALGKAKDNGQLKGFGVDVRSQNGVLELTGRASSAAQRDTILRIAESIPGVSGVREAIAIPSQTPTLPALPTPPVLQDFGTDSGSLTPVAVDPVNHPLQNGTPAVVASTPIGVPGATAQYRTQAGMQTPARQVSNGYPTAGQPVPMAPYAAGGAGPRYDRPNLPNYAWPGYAAYPNYAAVTYPQQYSPSAWPYIGPFYPYPQVPLGWRKVSLEWDDGWWFLDFTDR
jgi:osmotically-inducible protein OsmY